MAPFSYRNGDNRKMFLTKDWGKGGDHISGHSDMAFSFHFLLLCCCNEKFFRFAESKTSIVLFSKQRINTNTFLPPFEEK